MSNFGTNQVSITFGGSQVWNGTDYSEIGSLPSLVECTNLVPWERNLSRVFSHKYGLSSSNGFISVCFSPDEPSFT